MPYAKPRITRPLPRKAPARTPQRIPKPRPAGTLPFSQQVAPWDFAVRVYVAWDSATTANPAWIEVTELVDIPAGIRITRGRPDAEQQCQVGTCALTVDNSDGRWSPANPNGVWFGQIRKGCWLRVDVIPPSQAASTRFTGFIQQLPVSWEGQYSQVAISASDRFVLLGNAPKYQTAIVQEWLNDPVGGQYITGYWPLHEPAGAAYVSDISGNAPQGQATLTGYAHNVNPGNGLTFANAAGPGYDGISTVTFAPIGTALAGLFGSGALPNGSYLQGNVGPMGNIAQVSVWVQTTVAGQPIWSWANPADNYAMGLQLDSNGYAQIWQGALSGSSGTITLTNTSGLGFLANSRQPLNDGTWHLISIKMQALASGTAFLSIAVDGLLVWGVVSSGISMDPDPGMVRFTLGAGEGWMNNGSSQMGMFTGSLSDLVIHQLSATTQNPDWYGPYQAGTAMWQSPNAAYSVPESCGRRVARLAQYAGMPMPTESFTLPDFGNPAYDVTVGVTPFLNIPAETAHPAGMQQLQGQQPLTAMQAVAATENMPLFADKLNRITLQPSTLRQNPTAAFTINALDLDKTTNWADDFQYLQNEQVITPSGQGALTVDTNGLTSQALNGIYSNSVSTVTINPLESGSLGAAMNFAGANPAPRHNPLACEVATLANQTGASFYDAVLAAEISTCVGIVGWPQQSASASSGSYYIEGYTETIGAGQHMFGWNTSPAQGPTYQLDSPTLGLLDTPGITLAY